MYVTDTKEANITMTVNNHLVNGNGDANGNGVVTSNNGNGALSNNGNGALSNNGNGALSNNGNGALSYNGNGAPSNNGNGALTNNGNGALSNNGNGALSYNGNGAPSNNGNGVTSNGNGHSKHSVSTGGNALISLDRGDPKMFGTFWKKMDDKCQVTIKASELMSYFADNHQDGVFYQLPEFTKAVHQIHRVVGNAVTEGRYIIGGTGSSQLFIVALRALASTVNVTSNKRLPVVCAEPFYSCYEEALKEEKSAQYQWRGDAHTFDEEGPYVEVVTTPNNPDGKIREPVVKKGGGLVICDLAYYWPQYTPITTPADYDVMLFTLSKATGHAGSRVGWAVVKDKRIAMTMVKLMSLITIGSCQEGQFRATKILDFVAESYDHPAKDVVPVGKGPVKEERFFEFCHKVLAQRWEKLRAAVRRNGIFKLPDYSAEFCTFMNKSVYPNPAYAWLESKTGGDAEELMNELKIQTRAGPKFGVSSKYVRISMIDTDDTFNRFLERLSTLQVE